MEYVIGVDAGGTATKAAAYEWESGRKLAVSSAGFGNPLNGYDQALQHIGEAIAAVMQEGGVCRFLLAGVAGVVAGGLVGKMITDLSAKYNFPVRVESDARLALEGALHGGDGILLIAGTGSIAQGRNGEAMLVTGGYGNLVGDEGSGYDLVRRAVRLMVRDADQGLVERPVSRAVREFFGVSDARQVAGWLQSHPKGDVAAASPVVEQTALAGDPDAFRFLMEAGDALAELVLPLARRLELPDGFQLAVQGSILRKVAPVRDRMMDTLRAGGVTCTLLEPDDDLTCGAWYYARARQG